MTPRELDDLLFTGVMCDVVASSMATFVVTTDKLDEWREWLREHILTEIKGNPDGLKIYQSIARMPDEVVGAAIRVSLCDHQAKAQVVEEISKGLGNG